jgi:glutamyl-tRNA synthetase
MPKNVRTRFAPSPTGFLHVGGVRTALFNYLFAKQNGGQFILRLEDTDRERFVEEGVQQVIDALEWLGLEPGEGFWISEGKHQNIDFVQSERHKSGIYQKYADLLIEKGIAYRDWTTPEELAKYREQARDNKKPFIFRKDMAKTDGDKSKPHVIRFDVVALGEKIDNKDRNVKKKNGKLFVTWSEENHNTYGFFGSDVDDFIIIKGDGFPTYNFANVIDDHDMKITNVMRGSEFISSTPKHFFLYTAFGWNPPNFMHLPVINGTDGKKLSKRTGDTDVLEYQKKGYLPEALLNFLALLGWNDGTEQEIFSLKELSEKFKLSQINTSPAVFDQKRLDWISGRHMRQLKLDELQKKAAGFWPASAMKYPEDYRKKVLGLVQERLKFFAELPGLSEFFFKDLPIDSSLIDGNKKLKKYDKSQLKDYLQKAKDSLAQSDFSVKDLSERLNKLLEETDEKPAVIFSLIRIATTQAPASPELAPTLSVLGKERVLKRIDGQIAQLA